MRVKEINLPCNFDLKIYDISLDLENRKLVLKYKDGKEVFNATNPDELYEYIDRIQKGEYFFNLGKLETIFCTLENGEVYTLFNCFCSSNSPITFTFNRSVKGFLYDEKEKMQDVDEIEFYLSYIEDLECLKEFYKYEFTDFNIEIKIDNSIQLFNIKAVNKNNLQVSVLREKLNNILFFMSLLLYNPFAILKEKYVLSNTKTICEYNYDYVRSGYRKNRLINSIFITDLFNNTFTEKSINKFLSNLDNECIYFMTLYLYLIDKKNTNFCNISDFLMIQLMISAEQKYNGVKEYNKDSLENYFSQKYVKEFVKVEMSTKYRDKYLMELADTRNGIGHFVILFRGDVGSTIRKPTKSLSIDIFDYHKLLLIFPFFIYSVMGIEIDEGVLKRIIDDFETNFMGRR